MPPHLFAIADNAYHDMLQDRENQSILITGESGAGKTENTKKVIMFFAKVAASQQADSSGDDSAKKMQNKVGTLEEQIIQCNPVLEAYGNAKTVRNNNSSRFGKFIRIHFGPTGRIAGADIETYLLEKSRVTRQMKLERGFHIFYQLLTNSVPGLCEKLLLEPSPSRYSFVNQGMTTVEGLDDKVEMKATQDAMTVLGFTEAESKSLLSCTAAILWLGEMKFSSKGDLAEPDGTAEAEKVAFLLGLSAADLLKCLTKPKIKVGTEKVVKAQTREQVMFSVNALAKSLYSRMFDWLVKRCNMTLETGLRRQYFIGVLDIAGFEIFEFNSFEQLCINFTNERLQQFFNHHMFVLEQEQYRVEGIQWDFIDFGLDLQTCIDLIEKPLGIMAILEEECMFPKATDKTFIEKLYQHHLGKSPNFNKPKVSKGGSDVHFEIHHYAGTVGYNTVGWLERNKDPLNESVIETMAASVDPLVQAIFPIQNDEAQQAGRKKKSGSFITVSGTHRDSLNKLMKNLYSTHPHFVRCIIPNENKESGVLDAKLVLNQLRCNGVLEGIRICRKGFPNRILYPDFKQRYTILAPNTIPAHGFVDARAVTQKVLEALKLDNDQYKLGQTKVFFRAGVLAKLEEMRDEKLAVVMARYQALVRGYILRARYKKLWDQRAALAKIQSNIRKYMAFKDWKWWKLYMKIKPMLTAARDDDEIKKREEEFKKLQEEHERLLKLAKELEMQNAKLLQQKNDYFLELQAEQDSISDLEAKLEIMMAQRNDYEGQMKEFEQRNSDLEGRIADAEAERGRLEGRLSQLRADNSALEDKLSLIEKDKQQKEMELRKLRDELAQQEHQLVKTTKEKKQLEEEKRRLMDDLAAEEEKTKQLAKSKQQLESALDEMEAGLEREKRIRIDTEKAKRKLEADLKRCEDHCRDQEQAKRELEDQVRRKDVDLTTLSQKIEEDASLIAQLRRRIKELEARIAELEDELERERQARIRSERARQDAQRDLEEAMLKLEEANIQNQTQADTIKKRDAENAKLRRDMEEQRAQYEQALSLSKKKQGEQANELGEQLDQANKLRIRLESEKNSMRNEIDELQQQLEQVSKGKSSSDKMLKTMETQIFELQVQLDERSKAFNDASVERNRFFQERDALQAQFEELDVQMASMVKLRNQAQAQADEYRRMAEEETRAKSKAINELRMAQADLDKLREQLDEETEAKSQMHRLYQRAQNELQSLKQRIAAGEFGSNEMSEESRRRMQAKIAAAEQEAEELRNKMLQLEKSKQRCQQDLDETMLELQRMTSLAQQAEKKQRMVDKTINEYSIRIQDITLQLECSQKESRVFSAELFKLRAELEDARATNDNLKRENKSLNAELQELMLQISHGGRSVHEIEKVRRRLEAEVTELKTSLAEAESALEAEENKVQRLTVETATLKSEYDRRVLEKDEEFEGIKRAHLKSLEALQHALEAETRAKCELLHQKKKLENDFCEVESALDIANKSRADADKTLKRYQIQINELQIQLEATISGRDPLMEQLASAERKIMSFNCEVEDLRTALDQAERGRKSAENDLLEAQHRMAELSEQNHQLTGGKRKYEMDMQTLTSELETTTLELNSCEEKYKRLISEVSKLQDDLKGEQDTNGRLQNVTFLFFLLIFFAKK